MSEKSYLELTEYNLKNCLKVTDDSLIFKEIAHNLAKIADELSESNRFNQEMNGFCNLRFDKVRLEPEPEPEPQDEEKKNCFICGKQIELKDGCYDDGGCIITSEGDLFLACPKCKNRFDALTKHFVVPNTVYNEVFC